MKTYAFFLATLFLTSTAVAKPFTHDGFQARLTLGVGPSQTTENVGDYQINLNGLSGSGYLFLGYGPKQLTFGAYGGATSAPTVSIYANRRPYDQANVNSSPLKPYTSSAIIGGYVNPYFGRHIYALLGFGFVNIIASDGDGYDHYARGGAGFNMLLGFGYDVWAAKYFSVGALAKIEYSKTNLWSSAMTQQMISPNLSVSLCFQ